MSRGRRGRRRRGGGGPQGDRPQEGRPQGERSQGGRPQGGRPQGRKPPARDPDATAAREERRPHPAFDDGPVPELPPEAAPTPRDPDGEDVFTADDESAAPQGTLYNLVGVRFRSTGRVFDFDCGEMRLERGDRVVVEGDGGMSLATVAVPPARRMTQSLGIRRALRKPDANDLRQESRNRRREAEALQLCRNRLRSRKLDVQVARVEFVHGGGKVTVYVAAEQRVDLRDVARDLSNELHVRVDMRQVGARDAAKLVGAIGDCGRELCCSTFLQRFEPVSIRAAKDQNVPLNPAKLAGHCGRLKCCLVYEHALYVEAKKGLPKQGAVVATPKGEGRVQEIDVLRRRIRVALREGGFETFPVDDLKRVGAPPSEPDPEPPAQGIPEG